MVAHKNNPDSYTVENEGKTLIINDGVSLIHAWGFCDCTSLETVVIPDTVSIIDDYAFAGCHAMKSITIPDSVLSIGKGAFGACSGDCKLKCVK